MFSTTILIDPKDLESPYHHVHHATSLRYLEKARLQFMENIGQPNQDFLRNNLLLVITAIEINYLREVVGHQVRVTCEQGAVEGKVIRLFQRIVNAKGKTCVKAKVESMFMDGNSRRAVLPPEAFVQAFKEHTELEAS